MRLISKSRDYYDSALKMWYDETITYVRKADTREVSVRLTDILNNLNLRYISSYEVTPLLIGFAGKFYPVIEFFHGNDINEEKTNTYHYTYEELKKHLKSNRNKYLDKEFKRFFDNDYSSLEYLFAEYNSPIVVLDISAFFVECRYKRLGYELTELHDRAVNINVVLKDYEFYRVFDTYTAFQEISMYVSGVLNQGFPIMTEISDVSMRDKKGFYKYSFKTRPKC